MKAPAISVVMAVYNTDAEFLKEAVESILKQTFKNFELLIVDDGSDKKETRDYLKSIKDRHVKIFRQKNAGPGAARNRGIKHARGKYIAFMDSDDIALPERLKKQHAFMEKNTEYVLCGAKTLFFNSEGVLQEVPIDAPEVLESKQIFIPGICFSTYFARADVLRKQTIAFPDILFGEDYVFLLKCKKFGKLCNLPEVLLKYRSTPNSLSSGTNPIKYVEKYTYALPVILEENIDSQYARAHAILFMPLITPTLKDLWYLYRWIKILRNHPKITAGQRDEIDAKVGRLWWLIPRRYIAQTAKKLGYKGKY